MQEIISEFVMLAMRDFDWTAPKFKKEKQSYPEYRNSCYKIGSDYCYDVACLAKDRMIANGKLNKGNNTFDFAIYKETINQIERVVSKWCILAHINDESIREELNNANNTL